MAQTGGEWQENGRGRSERWATYLQATAWHGRRVRGERRHAEGAAHAVAQHRRHVGEIQPAERLHSLNGVVGEVQHGLQKGPWLAGRR